MVYTLLLEPFTVPEIVPVEVTILRGVRRLRFSSSLRRRYTDFSPRIWYLLNKLGYKKYLQRIYVTIEHNNILTSNYYQFPILLAILEALQLIPLQNELLTVGKLNAFDKVCPPFIRNAFPKATNMRVYIPTQQSFQNEVNSLLNDNARTFSKAEQIFSGQLLPLILPNYSIVNGGIDIAGTPVSALKKLTTALIPYIKFYLPGTPQLLQNAKSTILLNILSNATEKLLTVNDKKETATVAVSFFLKQFKKA